MMFKNQYFQELYIYTCRTYWLIFVCYDGFVFAFVRVIRFLSWVFGVSDLFIMLIWVQMDNLFMFVWTNAKRLWISFVSWLHHPCSAYAVANLLIIVDDFVLPTQITGWNSDSYKLFITLCNLDLLTLCWLVLSNLFFGLNPLE